MRPLLTASLLLLAGLVAVLLKDLVREAIVIPLAYAFSGAQRFVDSLPQPFVWIAFVGMCLVVAARALLATTRPVRSMIYDEREHRGRVERWLRWLDLMAETRGDYSRQYLARRLGDLVQDVLANGRDFGARDRASRGSPHFLVGHRLETPGLNVPPTIRSHLDTLMAASVKSDLESEDRTRSRAEESSLDEVVPGLKPPDGIFGWDFDLEEIVRFLEDQLEVRLDR